MQIIIQIIKFLFFYGAGLVKAYRTMREISRDIRHLKSSNHKALAKFHQRNFRLEVKRGACPKKLAVLSGEIKRTTKMAKGA